MQRRLTMKKEESKGISRRRLIAMAGLSAGATLLTSRPLFASQNKSASTKPHTAAKGENTSFGPLKQIDAGVLSVGYAEAGPADGRPVILLHGWPYDIHSYVDAAPLLASKGHRVIVPYLRGYGTTRLLSSDAMRNGQQSAIAADVIALMDALR